jgi:hypothetical protein
MEYIVFYNTLVGVAAGVGLIGVAKLLNKLYNKEKVATEGWALLFAPAGVILTVLGFAITITWPYRVPGTFDANILFGEPAIAFGLLLLAASCYLWRERAGLDLAKVWRILKPVSIYVFGVGLVMGACATYRTNQRPRWQSSVAGSVVLVRSIRFSCPWCFAVPIGRRREKSESCQDCILGLADCWRDIPAV